jgi:hypothetical protein
MDFILEENEELSKNFKFKESQEVLKLDLALLETKQIELSLHGILLDVQKCLGNYSYGKELRETKSDTSLSPSLDSKSSGIFNMDPELPRKLSEIATSYNRIAIKMIKMKRCIESTLLLTEKAVDKLLLDAEREKENFYCHSKQKINHLKRSASY